MLVRTLSLAARHLAVQPQQQQRCALCTSGARTWRVYLSGEIHSNWRDVIAAGVKKADLPVILTAPNNSHEDSDDCGAIILGAYYAAPLHTFSLVLPLLSHLHTSSLVFPSLSVSPLVSAVSVATVQGHGDYLLSLPPSHILAGMEEKRPNWDKIGASMNSLRTRTLLESSDIVVVRFGEKYRQWNAAFEAGYAAAQGKPIITLHPPAISHMLKEVNAAAAAVCEEPEQVVQILDYVITGKLPPPKDGKDFIPIVDRLGKGNPNP